MLRRMSSRTREDNVDNRGNNNNRAGVDNRGYMESGADGDNVGNNNRRGGKNSRGGGVDNRAYLQSGAGVLNRFSSYDYDGANGNTDAKHEEIAAASVASRPPNSKPPPVNRTISYSPKDTKEGHLCKVVAVFGVLIFIVVAAVVIVAVVFNTKTSNHEQLINDMNATVNELRAQLDKTNADNEQLKKDNEQLKLKQSNTARDLLDLKSKTRDDLAEASANLSAWSKNDKNVGQFVFAGLGYGRNKDDELEHDCKKGGWTVFDCVLHCYNLKKTVPDIGAAYMLRHDDDECCCEKNTVSVKSDDAYVRFVLADSQFPFK